MILISIGRIRTVCAICLIASCISLLSPCHARVKEGVKSEPGNIWEDIDEASTKKNYHENISKRISCAIAGNRYCREEIVLFILLWREDGSVMKDSKYTIDDAIFLARETLELSGRGLGFSRELMSNLYYEGSNGFPRDDEIAECYTKVQVDNSLTTSSDCRKIEMEKYGRAPPGRKPFWLDPRPVQEQ